MRKHFIGYYAPSEEEFKILWEKCVFVLDTNVLLNLYRYPESARNDLFKVLNKVSSRLWMPYHAALEYQERRLTVIAGQMKRFHAVRKTLTDSMSVLKNKLGELHLKERDSTIDPDTFLKRIQAEHNEFLNKLETLQKKQVDVQSDDFLRDQIDLLLEGKVGDPFTSEQLIGIQEEGKKRYLQKRPPGYMDDGKTDVHVLSDGTEIEGKYGDLIVWKQIIEQAKTNKYEYLIFVTDDKKKDWWWEADSAGFKIIGPRPELVSEIMESAGVSIFYMYETKRFMEFAKDILGVDVDRESIKQVDNISRISESVRIAMENPDLTAYVLPAVTNWLRSLYPHDRIKYGNKVDVARISQNANEMHGYSIKYCGNSFFRNSSYESNMLKIVSDCLEREAYDGLSFVYVFDNQHMAKHWKYHEGGPLAPPLDNISIVVGVLEHNDNKNDEMLFKFVPV